MKECDWVYRKVLKLNLVCYWLMYVKFRNWVNGWVWNVKFKYYCDMIEEVKVGLEKVWKVVNEVCNWNLFLESI